jgi:vacuolar-type H+-ATPase catalytic subunit A/Vma1
MLRAPLPGGLYFVPLVADDLDLIAEALGSYAGRLADEGRDYRPPARLQAQMERTAPCPN